MGAYQYFVDLGKARLKEAEARLQKAEEKGRRETKDLLRNWIENDLRKQGFSDEQIQRYLQQIEALGKKRKD